MRRRAEAERLQEEAELLFRFLVGDAHRGEDPLLHVRVVQADRAAADLESVQHQVVAVAEHPPRIGLQVLHVLVARPGEGVVRRDELLQLLVVFEERRVHDPEDVPARGILRVAWPVLRDEAQLLAEMQAQVGEHRVHL